MRLEINADSLRALIADVVRETLAQSKAEPPPDKPAAVDRLRNERQAAAECGVSYFTLKGWRINGLVESHSSVKPILYSQANIDAIKKWLAEREGKDAT